MSTHTHPPTTQPLFRRRNYLPSKLTQPFCCCSPRFEEFNTWVETREKENNSSKSEFAVAVNEKRERMIADGLAAAACEMTAKRLLLARARTRAELEARRIFRRTRSPNYGWCSNDWLHAHNLSHLILDLDLAKEQALKHTLRAVEEKCEVPYATQVWGGKMKFGTRKDVDEGVGLQRAQKLAEEECVRWLRSVGGKRALKKQG